MKKLILFFSILTIIAIIPSMVYSAAITRTTAEQVATNWYSERNDKAPNDFTIIESFIEKENTENIYFIFNFDKTGFVIVSADDAAIPILGYVFEHNYTLENHPPQFDAMLASFKDQIVYAKENNLSASQEAQNEWERLNVRTENFQRNRDFSRLGPLLSTTWDQNFSWNTYCPADASGPGGYVYAGCVAVAMAQIMNYWGHPTTGTGSHSYYCSPYGTLSADFGATTYSFPMNNTSPTNASRELLYHCGVSIDMQYGPSGSGAYTSDVVSALETYFDYDTGAYYDLKANHTAPDEWENMIRDNLDNSRPLQYRGYGTGGHSFNLDGYEDSDVDHFHFNWGWSGSYNGYFYLNDLTPGTHNFTSDQAAIFDIFPASGGVVVDTLSYYPNITYSMGVPNSYSMSKFGVYFTPADSCDLTKIKAYFYGTVGTPTSCDLRIYDALVDPGNGKEYPNNLLHTENIPIASIPTGWSEPEIVLSSPIHFDSGENFFIIYEIVGNFGTDQVNILRSAGCTGDHSVCEYNGSWYYHEDLWSTPFEMAMDAVVEYQSAPEYHDYAVSSLTFYGFFLPTETRANIDFEADIFNNGTYDETNVEIELIVTDTTYARDVVFSNSQYISLNSEVGGTVYFDTWTVSTPGEYIVTVTSKLTDDYESSNDMIDLEQQVCSYPTELTYDDGTAESAWVKNVAGNGFANKFTPPYIPYSISDISFHVWADTWPDPGSNEMKIMILDDDGTDGSPGTILYEEIVTVVRGTMNTYDLSGSRNINLDDGSFYVASITTADYPYCPGQSVDSSGPFAGQNIAWDLQDGVWTQGYASFGDEYMIRASVDFGSIDPPIIVVDIINDGADVELTWDPVPDANTYNVYSSLDPYGTFTIEPTGTAIPGTSWSESTSEKKFYYVTASTEHPPSRENYQFSGKTAIRKVVPLRKEVDKNSSSIELINKTSTLKRVR